MLSLEACCFTTIRQQDGVPPPAKRRQRLPSIASVENALRDDIWVSFPRGTTVQEVKAIITAQYQQLFNGKRTVSDSTLYVADPYLASGGCHLVTDTTILQDVLRGGLRLLVVHLEVDEDETAKDLPHYPYLLPGQHHVNPAQALVKRSNDAVAFLRQVATQAAPAVPAITAQQVWTSNAVTAPEPPAEGRQSQDNEHAEATAGLADEGTREIAAEHMQPRRAEGNDAGFKKRKKLDCGGAPARQDAEPAPVDDATGQKERPAKKARLTKGKVRQPSPQDGALLQTQNAAADATGMQQKIKKVSKKKPKVKGAKENNGSAPSSPVATPAIAPEVATAAQSASAASQTAVVQKASPGNGSVRQGTTSSKQATTSAKQKTISNKQPTTSSKPKSGKVRPAPAWCAVGQPEQRTVGAVAGDTQHTEHAPTPVMKPSPVPVALSACQPTATALHGKAAGQQQVTPSAQRSASKPPLPRAASSGKRKTQPQGQQTAQASHALHTVQQQETAATKGMAAEQSGVQIGVSKLFVGGLRAPVARQQDPAPAQTLPAGVTHTACKPGKAKCSRPAAPHSCPPKVQPPAALPTSAGTSQRSSAGTRTPLPDTEHGMSPAPEAEATPHAGLMLPDSQETDDAAQQVDQMLAEVVQESPEPGNKTADDRMAVTAFTQEVGHITVTQLLPPTQLMLEETQLQLPPTQLILDPTQDQAAAYMAAAVHHPADCPPALARVQQAARASASAPQASGRLAAAMADPRAGGGMQADGSEGVEQSEDEVQANDSVIEQSGADMQADNQVEENAQQSGDAMQADDHEAQEQCKQVDEDEQPEASVDQSMSGQARGSNDSGSRYAASQSEAAATEDEAAGTDDEAAATGDEAAGTDDEPAETHDEAAATGDGVAAKDDKAVRPYVSSPSRTRTWTADELDEVIPDTPPGSTDVPSAPIPWLSEVKSAQKAAETLTAMKSASKASKTKSRFKSAAKAPQTSPDESDPDDDLPLLTRFDKTGKGTAIGRRKDSTPNAQTKDQVKTPRTPRDRSQELLLLEERQSCDDVQVQQRFYPAKFNGLKDRFKLPSNSQCIPLAALLVKDVLLAEGSEAVRQATEGNEDISKLTVSYQHDSPTWWPTEVEWASTWQKYVRKAEAVYAAACARAKSIALEQSE